MWRKSFWRDGVDFFRKGVWFEELLEECHRHVSVKDSSDRGKGCGLMFLGWEE